jgi:hypothetical protein
VRGIPFLLPKFKEVNETNGLSHPEGKEEERADESKEIISDPVDKFTPVESCYLILRFSTRSGREKDVFQTKVKSISVIC